MSSDEDTFVSGHQAILDKLKFVSHAPPDIVKRPHIIGLCAVPMELAGLNVLGHHISDFLCWKMTFHREGNKDDQAWFSLVDIAAAMSEHKTRYSKVINGQAKDLSVALPFIRADSNVPNLFTAFVTELKKQADVAQQKGECLIVIVCGEVSPELDICLDTNQNKAYLRKESWLGSMLKSYSIPITIITPAIFTTGWEIRPFSGDPKEADEVSDEILDSLLAKQCGGAFAASVLGSWTQDHEASDMVPTVQGQEGQLYSQFYTGIHDCMVRNMLPFTKGHSFYFAADQDEWEMALGKRKGPLGLDHFAKKWDSVKNLDESGLAAQNGGYKFLAGAFGGSHESQLVHLNFLVRQELRGCPGEWDQPTSDLCLVALTSFLQTKYPTEERAREVFTLLEWRCSMNFVADVIVDFFVLPRPQGRVCRYWDWKEQQRIDKRVHGTGAFRMALFSEMCSRWPKIPLPAGQQRDAFRDLLYWRPLQYITSAITMKYYDPRPDGPSKRETDDAKEFMLKGIGDFIDRLAKLQRWMVKDNTQLIDLYDRWLATAKPGSIRPAWKPNSTTGRSTVDPPNAMLMEFDHMGTRDVVRPAKPAPSAVNPVLAQQRQRPAAAGMPAIAASAPSKASESSLNTTASQASSQRTVLPPATVSPAATQKTSIPSFAQQNTPAMTGNPGMPPMADEPKVTVAQQNTPAAIVKSTTTATPVHETKSAVTAGDKPEQKNGNSALEAISETLAGLDPSSLQSLITLLTQQAQRKELNLSPSGGSGYELAPGPSRAENTAPRVMAQPPHPSDPNHGRDDGAVSQHLQATNARNGPDGQQAASTTTKPIPTPAPASDPKTAGGVVAAPSGSSRQTAEQRPQTPAQHNTQAAPSTKQGARPPWENPEIEAMIRRREAYKARMAQNCKW